VHVDLSDGSRLTKRVDYPLGHAKNPLKDSEVEVKFHALVRPKLGEERAKKIVDLVWKLDEVKNVNGLMKAVEVPQ
jgi:2-methylcitrate dehydratase PrpD